MKTLVITSEFRFILEQPYSGICVGAYMEDEAKGALGHNGIFTGNFKFQNTPVTVKVYPLEAFQDVLNQFVDDDLDLETTFIKFYNVEGA